MTNYIILWGILGLVGVATIMGGYLSENRSSSSAMEGGYAMVLIAILLTFLTLVFHGMEEKKQEMKEKEQNG